MLKDYDYLFKLLIIGDMGVGKSSILLRFADNMFMDTYITTIGVDFKIRTVEFDKKRIKLQIWDTAGQERFRTITSVYYRNTHGVIVVYDVTNGESFANIKRWLKEIEQNCDTMNRVLVGNKVDDELNRIVLKEDAETFAERMRIRHYEISAKSNIGVEQLFQDLAQIVYEQKKIEEATSRRQVPDEVVHLKKNRFITKSKNCSC